MRLIGQANASNEYDDVSYDSVVLSVTKFNEESYRIVASSLYALEVDVTLGRYDSIEAAEYVMETLREENYNDRIAFRAKERWNFCSIVARNASGIFGRMRKAHGLMNRQDFQAGFGKR